MASGARPPRPRSTRGPSIRPVYETFEPKSELKEKDDAYSLHIYLPGFVKEKIKINFVRSSQVVRVVGERPLGGNRISNFEQSYPVPENCEVEKLQGKFESGTLVITMPKKKPIISQVSPKAQVETPTPLVSPSKKPLPKEAMPPKSPTMTTRMEQGEKSRNGHVQEETTMVKSTAIASTPRKETGKSQKGHDDEKIVPTKPTSTTTATTTMGGFGNRKIMEQDRNNYEEANTNKQNDITTYIENFRKKLHESVTQKEDNNIREDEKKPHQHHHDQKYIDHNVVLPERKIKTTKARKEGKESGAIVTDAKGKSTKKEEEDGEIYTIGKGIIKEVVASASEVVTKIGEGKLNDEEKPLVANMGAAILVIVALGAYVTYKFTSSTRA